MFTTVFNVRGRSPLAPGDRSDLVTTYNDRYVTQSSSAYLPDPAHMLSTPHLGNSVAASYSLNPLITQNISARCDTPSQHWSITGASAPWSWNPLVGRQTPMITPPAPHSVFSIVLSNLMSSVGLAQGVFVTFGVAAAVPPTRYFTCRVYSYPGYTLLGTKVFQGRYNDDATFFGGVLLFSAPPNLTDVLVVTVDPDSNGHPFFVHECVLVSVYDWNRQSSDVQLYLQGFGPLLPITGLLPAMNCDLILNGQLDISGAFLKTVNPYRHKPNWIVPSGYYAGWDPMINQVPFCIEAVINMKNVQYLDITVFGSVSLDTPERSANPAVDFTYTLPDGSVKTAAQLINAVDFETKPALQVIGFGLKDSDTGLGGYPIIYTTDVQHITSSYKTVGTILASPIRGLDFSGACSVTADAGIALLFPIPRLITPWTTTAPWDWDCHMFLSIRMKVLISATAELVNTNVAPIAFRGSDRTCFAISQTEFSAEVENQYRRWLAARTVPINGL